MGIVDLWDILDPVKQAGSLADFRGKKLAVDLSTWLVQCKTTPFSNRAIFSRILDLMSYGITPVFVLDSIEAPVLKFRKRGILFSNLNSKWEELLKAMGFQVIWASGEAEKTCAQLNCSGTVDGCITNDGDVFAYGATVVLKDYSANSKKLSTIHIYEMANIEEELSLGRKEMIAAAVLIGCDYCSGVEGVGKKTFLDLIKEMKANNINDILDRLTSWQTNSQLKSILEEKFILTSCKKGKHCSRCSHLGSIDKHEKDGCPKCCKTKNCKEWKSERNMVPCSCEFHVLENKVKPFFKELKVYESALNKPKFNDVIAEFLSPEKIDLKPDDIIMKEPDFTQVSVLSKNSFGLNSMDFRRFFPAVIKMWLYGQGPDLGIEPLEVLKTCKRNGETCYLVKFKKFEFHSTIDDDEQNENGYELEVLKTAFDSKFPIYVQKDEQTLGNDKEQDQVQATSSRGKGHKRGHEEDLIQKKIKDMFVIKKKTSIGHKSTQ